MDPFFGSFPLSLSEKTLQYRYPVNRIASSFTPLELDFQDDFVKMIPKELTPATSPQSKSLIDSLFDSDTELSEIEDLSQAKKSVEEKKKKSLPVNPFKISLEQVESDWKLIKQFIDSKPPSRNVKKMNFVDSKRITRHTPSNLESDDNCTVCLGKGKVICCDSCPRVFHLYCLDQVLDDGPLPEFWECKACRLSSNGRNTKNLKESKNIFFQELIDNLDGMNPRIFQLPSHITNSFENISSHPLTGNFINNSEMEFIYFNNSNQVKDFNPTIKRNQVQESDQLLHAYCYKCSRSNLKLSQTNLLASYSISQPNGLRLQCCNSELIKCDFCPLFWHLDCLDPPLTNVPPELRENEIEIVNLRSINSMKAKIWGRDSCYSSAGSLTSGSMLDGFYSIRKKWMCPCHAENITNIKSSGWKWCTVYEDPETQHAAGVDEIFLFSNSSRNNGHIEVRNEKETEELFEEMEFHNSKRAIGPIDRFEINGIRYRVPEKRIKLDFLSQSNKTKAIPKSKKYRVLPNGEIEFDQEVLDSMFPGLDTKYKLLKSESSVDILLEAASKLDSEKEEYIKAITEIQNPSRMK